MELTFGLARVQLIRKAAIGGLLILLLALVMVTGSAAPNRSFIHEGIEWLGLVMIGIAIVGRAWSTFYIGGRKIETLVREGPYSIVRNPLYVFSVIGAAGAGAQTGSLSVALLMTGLTLAVFAIVVGKEEAALSQSMGRPYLDYLAEVPRFIPDFRRWQGPEMLEIRPKLVVRSFLDACIFLAAIPLAETIEALQDAGVLPVLLHLY